MKTKNLAFALYSCRRECDSEDVVTADRSPATLERQHGGDEGVGRPGGCPALHDTGTQPGPPVPAVHEPRLPSLPSAMPQPLQDPTEQKPNPPGVELGRLSPPPLALLSLAGLTTVVQVANMGSVFTGMLTKIWWVKKGTRSLSRSQPQGVGLQGQQCPSCSEPRCHPPGWRQSQSRCDGANPAPPRGWAGTLEGMAPPRHG